MRKLLGLAVRRCCACALAAAAAQAGKAKRSVVNLTFATYVWQPTTVAAMKQIVDVVEQERIPSIQVSIVPVDVNSVHDKLLTSFVGGTRGGHHPRRGRGHRRLHPAGLPGEPDAADPEEPEGGDPEGASGTRSTSAARSPACRSCSRPTTSSRTWTCSRRPGIKAPTVAKPVDVGRSSARSRRSCRRTATSASAGASARRPRRSRRSRSTGAAQWNYLAERQVGAQGRHGREDDPARPMHDMIYVDKSIDPAGVGLSGSAVLPAFFARQVRDDGPGQLPGAGHDRAGARRASTGRCSRRSRARRRTRRRTRRRSRSRRRASTRPRRCSSSPTR